MDVHPTKYAVCNRNIDQFSVPLGNCLCLGGTGKRPVQPLH